MKWIRLIGLAALALGCAEQHSRLTGAMPPPAIVQRCNEYAAAVEAKSDAAHETTKGGAEPAGDRIAEEAPTQHGVDERNQDSDRARNAYGDCLARNGY